MKKLCLFLIGVLFLAFTSNSINAQVLATEDFNFTAGTALNGTNGWTAHSGAGTNAITITSPGLTYAGYLGSGIGNAVSLTTTGEDNNKALSSSITSGTVYAAALVNCSAAQSTGDYFFHLGTGTSTFVGRVYIKSSGSGFVFGLGKNNGTPVYSASVMNFGTTYLVVIKYTVVSGTSNDQADLFFFSAPTLPSTEPAASLTTTDAGSSSDPSSISAVYLRQGSSSNAATVQVDGIRVGITWSDVLPVSGPTAPTATAATNVSSVGFTANWNAFTGSTGYFLDVSAASDFSTFVAGYNNTNVGNVTGAAIVSLDPNTTYYYRVRSTDGTTTTSSSNVISVTTIVAAPVAIDATNISSSGFTANWNAVAGATGYRLDVSSVSDFSSFLTGYSDKDAGNFTSASISGLMQGQTYYYRVRALNSNGTGPTSNIITVQLSALAAPVALDASNISFDGFTANWSAFAGATSYFIDVSTVPDFSTMLDGYNSKEVGSVTTLNITSLNASSTYYYRVHAATAGGNSPNSNVISVVTLLTSPVATAATNITRTSFTAHWNAQSGATCYWIDVSTTSDFSSILTAYNNKPVNNVTSYNITSLTPNVVYYYRISSSNPYGTSPYSNTISVQTLLVGISDNSNSMPNKYELSQNYPNPFNPSTIIKYSIPEGAFVTLKVYNMVGEEVATLVNANRSAGNYEARFNAVNLPSGTYLYKIQAGSFSQIKKMILVK